MRKQKHLFDYLFWYSLYALPLIILLLSWFRGTDLSFSGVFSAVGLELFNDNMVLTALVDIFGSNSQYFPLFSDNEVLIYLSYFICLVIIHIAVDVILFIPRYCHKILDGEVKCNDELWK